MRVRDIMTKRVIVVKIPGSRRDALKLLAKHKKTGLPVLKRSDNSFVGFVTRQDVFNRPDEEQLALLMRKNHPTAKSNTSIKEAAKILVSQQVHHLPVVDNKKLVGIVTPTNFLAVIEKLKLKEPVMRYLDSPCVPIYEETPLNVVADIIRICGVNALPVLNKKSRLSGIITDRDLFGLSVVKDGVKISSLGLGNDEDVWSWVGLRNIMRLYYETSEIELPSKPVKTVMIRSPVSVYRKTSVSEAARIMRKNDFGQLPIRDENDKLYGMVYDIDLIKVIVE